MMNRPALAAILAALSLAACSSPPPGADSPHLRYPAARRADVVDVIHSVAVADPYRWLEDADAPETRRWIDAQNALTESYLAAIPARATLRRRLEELWDYERYGVPIERGGAYFFTRNDGLQNQAVLYVAPDAAGSGRAILDPNALSSDGTVALAGTSVSEDGRYVAYGLAEAGSDWNVWRVRDVASGRDLDEQLRWIKFSGAEWKRDSSGFFYGRYDAPAPGAELLQSNYDQKLYFHRLGTPQSEDVLVYARPDQREWSFAPKVSDDGRWLVIEVGQGTDPRNRVFYAPLEPELGPVTELIGELEAQYEFVESQGSRLWFVTDLDAPRRRVIEIDVAARERSAWRTLVPEAGPTLEGASVVGGRFVCRYLEDAHTAVRVHELDGAFVRVVELPGLGTAGGFQGRPGAAETFYSFASFASPPTVHAYDVATGASRRIRAPEVLFDPRRFVTEQVFASSADGTRIPMFVTCARETPRDGARPTLLYGYGGFNVSITPSFDPGRIAWMELGGVFAVANLRGGGEYGEEWHRAGTKLAKQNVFDDFAAAARHLVAIGWTRPDKLAIQGGSNGGLLVGATLNQHPELFGAALPAVGVMDMLRYERFTIGWAWASDYGSVSDPDEFRALYAYSPYHNVREGACYPPVLVTTADHDDRVVPGHSFKYAAALQRAQSCDGPILIRIETRAGHGAGKPTSKRIDESADVYAFLVRALGIE